MKKIWGGGARGGLKHWGDVSRGGDLGKGDVGRQGEGGYPRKWKIGETSFMDGPLEAAKVNGAHMGQSIFSIVLS